MTAMTANGGGQVGEGVELLQPAEAVTDVLHTPGTAYTFAANVVNNLDGSGGLIKNHGDVTNPTVTYAFASAMART